MYSLRSAHCALSRALINSGELSPSLLKLTLARYFLHGRVHVSTTAHRPWSLLVQLYYGYNSAVSELEDTYSRETAAVMYIYDYDMFSTVISGKEGMWTAVHGFKSSNAVQISC